MSEWTHDEAIELCKLVESICPPFGCHVALTGGLLYKDGPRKDADLLFYRIRSKTLDRRALLAALVTKGFVLGARKGWLRKATYNGKRVDLFFPELPAEWDPGAPEADHYNFAGNE